MHSACLALRNRRFSLNDAQSLLTFLGRVLPSEFHVNLAGAIFALNAGHEDEAYVSTQTLQPESPIDRYLVAATSSRASNSPNRRKARLNALADALNALKTRDAVEVADRCSTLFDPPLSVKDLGFELINELRQNESYQSALKVIDRLREFGYQDSDIDRVRAEIIGQSGSRGDAVRQLDQLLKQQEAANQHDAATVTLESMVTLLPSNQGLRNRLVEKYLRVGQFEKAIRQLENFGETLHRSGRADESMAPLHRAIEIAGMIGNWDRVDQIHQNIIGLDPENTAVRHSAVATYVQLGRTDDAIGHLREIVKIARKRKDPDEAIAALHQMLALAPEDAATYHQLGELLVAINEYGQAERVYRRLESIAPDDPSIPAKRSAIAAMTRNRS